MTPIIKFKGIQKDIIYAILFGILSVVLRFVQFKIPGYEEISSDLRDIPLLVAVFHIRSRIVLIIFGFLTLLSAPQLLLFSERALIYSLPHVLGLLFAWHLFRIISQFKEPDWVAPIYWSAVVLVYYYFFLVPAAAYYYDYTNSDSKESIMQVYISIVTSTPFEVIATILATSLYLVQMNSKRALANHNINLESILKLRTAELQTSNERLVHLNEELMSSSEKIRLTNNNLEDIVRDRTEKINYQLSQLSKYAHMNSHDVRAPLARIMGLVQLIGKEEDDSNRKEIIRKLESSANELDRIIKQMTHLLAEEVHV